MVRWLVLGCWGWGCGWVVGWLGLRGWLVFANGLGVVSLVIAGGGLVGWVGAVPGLGCAVGWFLVVGGWRGSCRG